jgi:hypothetical protein
LFDGSDHEINASRGECVPAVRSRGADGTVIGTATINAVFPVIDAAFAVVMVTI